MELFDLPQLLNSPIALCRGKFKVQTETEKQVCNDCARLIANAVIYFNTALLSKVYEQKVAAGDLDALTAQYADSVFWSNATQPGQGDLFD